MTYVLKLGYESIPYYLLNKMIKPAFSNPSFLATPIENKLFDKLQSYSIEKHSLINSYSQSLQIILISFSSSS